MDEREDSLLELIGGCCLVVVFLALAIWIP